MCLPYRVRPSSLPVLRAWGRSNKDQVWNAIQLEYTRSLSPCGLVFATWSVVSNMTSDIMTMQSEQQQSVATEEYSRSIRTQCGTTQNLAYLSNLVTKQLCQNSVSHTCTFFLFLLGRWMSQHSECDIDVIVNIIHCGFHVPLILPYWTFIRKKLLPRIWVVESCWSAEIQSMSLLVDPCIHNTSIEEV